MFESHPQCNLCVLCEKARSIGLPTEIVSTSLRPGPDIPALVVCGQNPGRIEDRDGGFFLGRSGGILRESYLAGIDAEEIATIYLSNACRCGPDSITTVGPYDACHPYLIEDLTRIGKVHSEARRVLLFCSAPAVKAFYKGVLGEKVKQRDSFSMQGRLVSVGGYFFAVFSTYHPAYLLHNHNEEITAVDAHLQLVSDYIAGLHVAFGVPNIVKPRYPV